MAIYAFSQQAETRPHAVDFQCQSWPPVPPLDGYFLSSRYSGPFCWGRTTSCPIMKMGVVPWKGWARVYSHYSEVVQVAGFILGNDPVVFLNVKLSSWSLSHARFSFLLCSALLVRRANLIQVARQTFRQVNTHPPRGDACVHSCVGLFLFIGLMFFLFGSTPSETVASQTLL
jgi:hypothetical protein